MQSVFTDSVGSPGGLGRPSPKPDLSHQRTFSVDSSNIRLNLSDEALEDLGFVIDDDLDDSIQDVLSGNESGLDRESLWRRVVDEVVGLVQSSAGTPYGKSALKIVESFWSFPAEARDYASSKIVNPLIEEVQEAIKVSEGLRADEDLEALKAKNQLGKVEKIIKDLEEVLGEEDIRFQTIANAYADEVCACAVKALNKFKDPKLAMSLIQWADSLPSFSRVKSRIEENLEIIQGWVEEDEEDELFGELVKKLKVDVYTLTQASNMLEDMKRELAKIKFELYNGSKLRTAVEERGGKSVTFPDMADRVSDDIYSKRMSIAVALKELPIGNRAELTRWRNEAKKVLEAVVHE